MAMSVSGIVPVAHLPLILGVLRKLAVAALIADLLPPHPDNVIACGRGVAALVLAILDGNHALYKVGVRWEERGLWPLLQEGLQRESGHDDRLGLMLATVFAANLNRVFGALALKALEVSSLETAWLQQETTTLYGASEASEAGREIAANERAAPVVPRPAYGHSQEQRPDLTQVVRSVGGSGAGGWPRRLGIRDGHTSDSTEMPVAIAACLALGRAGMVGIVADSNA
jgi:transposase